MWKKVFHRLGKSLLKRKGKVEYKGKHGKKKRKNEYVLWMLTEQKKR